MISIFILRYVYLFDYFHLKDKETHYGCCDGCGEMGAIDNDLKCFYCWMKRKTKQGGKI